MQPIFRLPSPESRLGVAEEDSKRTVEGGAKEGGAGAEAGTPLEGGDLPRGFSLHFFARRTLLPSALILSAR